MQIFYNYHSKISKLINSEFWLFEFSIWLHSLAFSLIYIFIPILLLNLNYSIKEVIIYYLLFYGFNVFINFFAEFLVRQLGARIVIIISRVFAIIFFFILYNLSSDDYLLLFLLALSLSIYDALYWVAHIYFFMRCSPNDEDVSGDNSSLEIMRRVAGVLAPALGAAVLIFFNQKVLVAISILILFMSVVPLLSIKNVSDKPRRKRLELKKFFNSWHMIRDYLSRGFFASHDTAENIIWPIFIFTIYNSFESVAFLPIIISFTAMICIYFTGKIEKSDRKKIVIIASLIASFVWMSRIFVENNIFFNYSDNLKNIFYYFTVFVMAITSVMIYIPIDNNLYEKGEAKDALLTATLRNAFGMFFRFLFFLILFFLVNVFHVSFLTASFSLVILFLLNYSLVGNKY